MPTLFAHAWVNNAHAPMYVLRAPSSASVGEMKAYCARYDEFAERLDHKLGWVTDLSSVLVAGAVQRKLFFEAMSRQRPVFDMYAIALGVAAPNPLHRGLAHLVTSFSPIKQPMSVHACVYDAMVWVRARMAEAGVYVAAPQQPRAGPG